MLGALVYRASQPRVSVSEAAAIHSVPHVQTPADGSTGQAWPVVKATGNHAHKATTPSDSVEVTAAGETASDAAGPATERGGDLADAEPSPEATAALERARRAERLAQLTRQRDELQEQIRLKLDERSALGRRYNDLAQYYGELSAEQRRFWGDRDRYEELEAEKQRVQQQMEQAKQDVITLKPQLLAEVEDLSKQLRPIQQEIQQLEK